MTSRGEPLPNCAHTHTHSYMHVCIKYNEMYAKSKLKEMIQILSWPTDPSIVAGVIY